MLFLFETAIDDSCLQFCNIKLNDFNRARFIRWNAKKQKSCPFEISKSPGKVNTKMCLRFTHSPYTHKDLASTSTFKSRSPEEYNGEALTEKIDVFSLGNILLTILRQKRLYSSDNDKTSDVQTRVRNGIFPTANISASELSSYDPLEMTLFQVVQACLVLNIDERSTAAEVEKVLRDKMNELQLQY